jgi:hypothetical protein
MLPVGDCHQGKREIESRVLTTPMDYIARQVRGDFLWRNFRLPHPRAACVLLIATAILTARKLSRARPQSDQ